MAIYKVLFTNEKNLNSYAEMLYLDWEPLEGFVRYETEYTVILPLNYMGTPKVDAVTEDPNATWKRDEDLYKITITVTAEDGTHTTEYVINFVRENSIPSFVNETEVLVYPNPSSNMIHFVIDEQIISGSLEIFSLEGKRMSNYHLQGGTNAISIEHLQSGIYFYKIFSDNVMMGTGKFVKK
jgi:hypothetical protein